MAEESARIEITTIDGRTFRTIVPGNMQISALAGQFIRRHVHMPSRARQARAVVERLSRESPEAWERLDGNLTVSEAALADGDTLRVYSETVAGCFLAETLITLADGQKKPISDLRVGEEIVSVNPRTLEKTITEVVKKFVGLSAGYLVINRTLFITASHPVWVGTWVRAGDLRLGDAALAGDGESVSIESIAYKFESVPVYNLHVSSPDHTFIADNFVVHNMESAEKSMHASHLFGSPYIRPAIPSTLQRQIKIDAGHRCAVCGSPDQLEIASINVSEKHKAENLVCLCANCHRRADSEDWGERTLQQYKTRPWAVRQSTTPEAVSKTKEAPGAARTLLEVTISVDLPQFDESHQQMLRHAIASLLNISPEEVTISSVEEG